MIRNIVFDLGQVLLHFDPKAFLQSLYNDEQLINHLLRQLFHSQIWLDLDRGTVEFDEVLQILIEHEPHYKKEYTYLIHNWTTILTPIEQHVALLPKLKQEGYNLYYLSNFQRDSFVQTRNKYDFFQLFDGGVASYEKKLMKPEPEIYHSLLSQYQLVAEECLFIDDAKKNVDGAAALGFHIIHCVPGINLEKEIYHRLTAVNDYMTK